MRRFHQQKFNIRFKGEMAKLVQTWTQIWCRGILPFDPRDMKPQLGMSQSICRVSVVFFLKPLQGTCLEIKKIMDGWSTKEHWLKTSPSSPFVYSWSFLVFVEKVHQAAGRSLHCGLHKLSAGGQLRLLFVVMAGVEAGGHQVSKACNCHIWKKQPQGAHFHGEKVGAGRNGSRTCKVFLSH